MIRGGNATIFVSDMQRAVTFYTEALGLNLVYRAGDHWATIDAGEGLMLGLHPKTDTSPEPGAPGAIEVGLQVHGPLEPVVNDLKSKGVTFRSPITNDDPVRIAPFADPDDNHLYLFSFR